ncbi:hypothetical protein SH2C18_09020 [Clostridium sediminicola]|uniref:hypothetical protein n=1 Tax=Clostridium sediminicola TaxID=3114879 RepID=UPI0031F25576
MNKERVYTISFILSSILAISAMMYSLSNNKNIVHGDIKKSVSVREEIPTEKQSLFKEKEIESSNDKENNGENNEMIENIDEVTKTNENEQNLSNNNDIVINNVKEKTVEDIPVFKIASSEILSNLSLIDKENLLVIGSKLAPLDYARVKEYLYMKDREEGVKKTILLLKERLSSKDYKKVKNIMDDYINMELMEKEDEK